MDVEKNVIGEWAANESGDKVDMESDGRREWVVHKSEGRGEMGGA